MVGMRPANVAPLRFRRCDRQVSREGDEGKEGPTGTRVDTREGRPARHRRSGNGPAFAPASMRCGGRQPILSSRAMPELRTLSRNSDWLIRPLGAEIPSDRVSASPER